MSIRRGLRLSEVIGVDKEGISIIKDGQFSVNEGIKKMKTRYIYACVLD